jgi:stalled ribosome rescue protein Dom34
MPTNHAANHAANHAIVWLDHHEAKVFFVARNSATEFDVATADPDSHLRHAEGSVTGKRNPADTHFLHAIVEALKPAREWLIVGPGQAKLELVKHIHHHDAALSDHIIAVETVDHPTDRQIVAYARKYFTAADRLL